MAEPGHLLLSADYSQIELRDPRPPLEGRDAHRHLPPRRGRPRPHLARGVRAALAGPAGRAAAHLEDGQLRAALREDGLHPGQGHRRVARRRRRTFIEAYFARYPSVRALHRRHRSRRRARRAWCARCSAACAACPTCNAQNFQVRMEAERQAMNTPVQGSAADLIKKAMIDLAPRAARARAAVAAHPADPRRAAARGAGGRGGDGAGPGEARSWRARWRWTCRSWWTRGSARAGRTCTRFRQRAELPRIVVAGVSCQGSTSNRHRDAGAGTEEARDDAEMLAGLLAVVLLVGSYPPRRGGPPGAARSRRVSRRSRRLAQAQSGRIWRGSTACWRRRKRPRDGRERWAPASADAARRRCRRWATPSCATSPPARAALESDPVAGLDPDIRPAPDHLPDRGDRDPGPPSGRLTPRPSTARSSEPTCYRWTGLEESSTCRSTSTSARRAGVSR